MSAEQAAIIAACIGGGSAIVAAVFAWKSNQSAERAKAFAPTVVALEIAPRNCLQDWYSQLTPLSRDPGIVKTKPIRDVEFTTMCSYISTDHITRLTDGILEDYPIESSRTKIQSLVADINQVVDKIKADEDRDTPHQEELEELKKAIANLKHKIKSDLDAENARLRKK